MVSIYNLSPDHCKQSLVLNLSLNILAQIWLMEKKTIYQSRPKIGLYQNLYQIGEKKVSGQGNCNWLYYHK